MFVFKNNADSEFFFIKKTVGAPVLLTKSNYQKVIDEEFIYDCNEGSFQEKYTSIKYSSTYLSRLVLDYNTCKNPNYEEDLTYLSNGLYKIGLSLGTGMGPILLKNYPFDSPDLLSSVSIEYFKNKESSLTANLGF